jgi:hypothetical protein
MKTPPRSFRRFPRAIYVPWASDELRAARIGRVQTLAHHLALQTGTIPPVTPPIINIGGALFSAESRSVAESTTHDPIALVVLVFLVVV